MNEFETRLKQLNYERMLAVHEESVIRESCFLPITLDICGIEVKQFTFQHYVMLDFIKSPLLTGKEIEGSDVLTFLWIVSVNYKPNDKSAFEKFVADKCVNLDCVKAVEECEQYLINALLDSVSEKPTAGESTKKSNEIPYYSWVAVYIDMFGKEYGWHPSEIMSLPTSMVFQLGRVIESRNGKKEFVNGLSDKCKKQILELLNEKAKLENKILVLPDDAK